MKSNIDREYGIIYLHGEVDSDMYGVAARGLADLSVTHENITMVLNTEGGDFYQALAIYDLIRIAETINNTPVKILCVGPVMSSGVIILSAASSS